MTSNRAPEFIRSELSGEDTTQHASLASRDMMLKQSKMQLYNRNSLLPQINASAGGSIIQYNNLKKTSAAHGHHPHNQTATRTQLSMNPVMSEGGRSSQQNRAVG